METPVGWKRVDLEAVSSFDGLIAIGGKDTLTFSLGFWSSLLHDGQLLSTLQNDDTYVPAKKHEKKIDGFDAYTVVPQGKSIATARIYIDSLYCSGPAVVKFDFYGNHLSKMHQKLFYEVVQTIKFEQHMLPIIWRSYAASTSDFKSNRIPDRIFQMTQLRNLSIDGMDCDVHPDSNCWMITEIPAKIGNLKELESLRLTLGAFNIIPDELADLQHLKLLDFTDCSLSNVNLAILTKIKSLESLYLYGCGLSKLPDSIGNLVHLKELGLKGNHFDKTEQARIRRELPNCQVSF